MLTGNDRVTKGEVLGMDAIAIHGPFDFNDDIIEEMAEDTIREGKTDVVFNLKGAPYVSSPGIACLIKVLKRVQVAKGTLYIHGATADMIELLKLTRLGGYLKFV
jgi:anti-anti-sigma factor